MGCRCAGGPAGAGPPGGPACSAGWRAGQPHAGSDASARQGHQLVAMPLDASGQVQLDQGDADRADRQAGSPRQLVDIDRRGTQRAKQAGLLARRRRRAGRGAAMAGLGLGTPRVVRMASAPADGPSRSMGARTSSTSSGSVTRVAPVLRRRLVPSARGSSGWPGTANTSRPCSAAMRAVISVPDRRAASTMTTPSETPEMMRLRRGKSLARGTKPGGCSLTRQPRSPIWACSRSCSGG